MTYQVGTEILEEGSTYRYTLQYDDQPLSRGEVLALWQADAAFVSSFTRLLAEAPFEAYFWETPPLTPTSLGQPFEFVLTDSPPLARVSADPRAFAVHFSAAGGEPIAAFPNLGRDACLVTPSPVSTSDAYPHLAAFSRQAPQALQQALWQRVGREAEARLGDSPLWVSTSGLGVFWLHVRLDEYPKYYTWKPYTLTGPSSAKRYFTRHA